MSCTGLLGGTFNPPHNGHVLLAETARKRFDLDPLRVHVERAVSWLLSQGLILEIRRPGVPPYYQRHPQQREEITRFLEGA